MRPQLVPSSGPSNWPEYLHEVLDAMGGLGAAIRRSALARGRVVALVPSSAAGRDLDLRWGGVLSNEVQSKERERRIREAVQGHLQLSGGALAIGVDQMQSTSDPHFIRWTRETGIPWFGALGGIHFYLSGPATAREVDQFIRSPRGRYTLLMLCRPSQPSVNPGRLAESEWVKLIHEALQYLVVSCFDHESWLQWVSDSSPDLPGFDAGRGTPGDPLHQATEQPGP